MTDEHRHETSRLDLRALGLEPGEAREDAVVGATLRRLTPRADDITPLLRLRRSIAIAAAALVLLACASLLLARSRGRPLDGDAQLMAWARSGYVPTNAELLAVYQGYQP